MIKEITIQFTEECNVSCPYCFAPYKRNIIPRLFMEIS